MNLTNKMLENLLNAEGKALATSTNNDINVVPVSSVKVVDGKIWLIDYFFDKTRANIKENPQVALTFWIGLEGYQVKAKVDYKTDGKDFETATKWIAKEHPNRLVVGLLVLHTTEVFDISIHNKRI